MKLYLVKTDAYIDLVLKNKGKPIMTAYYMPNSKEWGWEGWGKLTSIGGDIEKVIRKAIRK